jgi:hypothetical protein
MAISLSIILYAHSDRCHSSVAGSDNLSKISCGVSNSGPTLIVPIPPRRMELIAPMAHEKYPTSLTRTDGNVLYIGNDRPRQLRDSQDSLSFDDDVESGVQK